MKFVKKCLLAVVVLTVIALSIFCGVNGVYSLANGKSILKTDKNCNTSGEIATKQASIENADAPFELQRQGRGAVCMEQSTYRILWSENEHEKCYPASTTKILTAILAIENLPLEKIVTVPKAAEGVEGSSIYLRCGQKISVRDLLFGLMLRSGNDAAVALAIETSGSVEDFATLMNLKAKSVGAVNSHFSNPHGLDDKTHYTTAYDMALIAAYAYQNDEFCKIASAKKATINVDGENRYIANKNKLLAIYDGANGVKTGYTKRDGRCLVGGAKREGMQVVSVVFNHSDMWNDTVRMLDFAFDNFKMTPIEQGLLSKGEYKVICPSAVLENVDWSRVYYPLKKDGSERLVVF